MPDSTRQEQIAVGNKGELAQHRYYKKHAWKQAGKGSVQRPVDHTTFSRNYDLIDWKK